MLTDLGQLEENERLLMPADLTGDGQAELIIQNEAIGNMTMAVVETEGWTRTFMGAQPQHVDLEYELINRGYFNADASADLLFRHVETGDLYLVYMNGPTAQNTLFLGTIPLDWELIHVLDVDGDGSSDMLFRYTDGTSLIVRLQPEVTVDALPDSLPEWDVVRQ